MGEFGFLRQLVGGKASVEKSGFALVITATLYKDRVKDLKIQHVGYYT